MNFSCPHCGMAQIATASSKAGSFTNLRIGPFDEIVDPAVKAENLLSVLVSAICCANQDCKKATINVSAGTAHDQYGIMKAGSEFLTKRIYPANQGKPYPLGVPAPMLQDYNEAWSIIDLSPKSAATLARRCLQAMIRDFCNITRKNLHQEIEALEKALKDDALPKGVDVETVRAMKALRDVGNIGAHMSEMDGLIVNVDPGEAEALLKLIEMLFNDWYVARHNRRKALADIEAIGALKVPPATHD
jgi:hypothetical protein